VTRHEYTDALERLRLNHTKAAALLGIIPKSSSRYAKGRREVPATVANMLRLMLAKEISADEVLSLLNNGSSS
jgi:DNA-binding transcriptional regulator YdaS (Cro superfamily)